MVAGEFLPRRIRFFFGPGRRILEMSAPGRLDVMGGFGDYSGSRVLQMPLAQRTRVFLSKRDDECVRVRSVSAEEAGWSGSVQFPVKELVDPSYEELHRKLTASEEARWAAYVLGCFGVLSREKQAPLCGTDLWIDSTVPIGKGISSSASLEISVMTGLAHLFGIRLRKTEIPLLAQKVENVLVGAPCGLMDQLTSYLGVKDHLLPILCQPDQVSPEIPIPDGITFVGIDSGVRHSIGGASYIDVRTAAFMGYSIIARNEGCGRNELRHVRETGDRSRLPFGGYLSNIPPSVYNVKYRASLPEKMTGRVFASKYGVSIDSITRPAPDVTYNIRACTDHPVYENQRVRTFELLIRSLNSRGISSKRRDETLETLGELMYQAHGSYSLCSLQNEVTDALVETVRRAGPGEGVYGAKVTGGGNGGSVCVLCKGRRGVRTVRRIALEIARDYGHPPVVFLGSSDGARNTPIKIHRT